MHVMVSTVMASLPTNLTNLFCGQRLGVAGEYILYSSTYGVLLGQCKSTLFDSAIFHLFPQN